MRPAVLLASTLLLASSQAQLVLPFFNRKSGPSPKQHPMMDIQAPGIQLPPTSGDDKPTEPAPPTGDVILSDVIGNQRQINIFAGFTRDVSSVSERLDTNTLNTTVLAPSNSAIQALPRKPWEDPRDYDELGTQAYEGKAGEDRAARNLRRFTEAHIVPQSPWKGGERVKTLAGGEVWWEIKGGKKIVKPGDVEVERVVSQVANGEVWVLGGVMNYAG
jgi:hypothetical protein